MKREMLCLGLIVAGGFFASLPGRADGDLSAEKFDWLDKQTGFFTPKFKAAIHDLVESKQTIVAARKEDTELTRALPALQKQADDADASVAKLRKELAEYDHTDEADFVQLQQMMNDPKVEAGKQREMAQFYVWAYPASPHQAEAQQDLQTAQKKLDDEAQAKKDAEVARAAAEAKFLLRVQAKELTLAEWREFLQGKSQEDVIKYLGRPQSQGYDNWVYSGDWSEDPATHQKIGLQINFNAARVISISEVAH